MQLLSFAWLQQSVLQLPWCICKSRVACDFCTTCAMVLSLQHAQWCRHCSMRSGVVTA
jgi:hypothetical protein